MSHLGQHGRDLATIDEDASLEFDQFWMVAVVEGVLAELRDTPAVNGNMEAGAGVQGGYEASHCREAKRTSIVGESVVGDDMAVNLEFLQGDARIAAGGEEKHVPIFIAHGGGDEHEAAYVGWDVGA